MISQFSGLASILKAHWIRLYKLVEPRKRLTCSVQEGTLPSSLPLPEKQLRLMQDCIVESGVVCDEGP